MTLKIKTRMNAAPLNKARILLAASDKDAEFRDELAEDLLLQGDHAVYYFDTIDEHTERFDAEQQNEICQMQVIIIAVTKELIVAVPGWLKTLQRISKEAHIPLLPILQENISLGQFELVFGKVQFISKVKMAESELPFETKLDNTLIHFIPKNEETKKIIECFRKKLFVSYRKSDRLFAHQLIQSVYSCFENYDIAVWYDEFLTGGEKYNDEIQNMMAQSDDVVMVITPDMIQKRPNGSDNYVVAIEYPGALKLKKEIVAVEMQPTDPKWKEIFPQIEKENITDADHAALFFQHKMSSDSRPLSITEKPEKLYYLGLAFVNGIMTKTNREIGLELIKQAAEAKYLPAFDKMYSFYKYGNVLEQDLKKAYEWFGKKISVLEEDFQNNRTDDAAVALASALNNIVFNCIEDNQLEQGIFYGNKLEEHCQQSTKDMDINIHAEILLDNFRANAASYLGDIAARKGNMDKAIQLTKRSCTIDEILLSYLNSLAPADGEKDLLNYMLFQCKILPHVTDVKKDLLVNYDHLVDYLTNDNRRFEAAITIKKRNQLLRDINGENVTEDDIITLTKQADIAKKQNNIPQAITLFEKALAMCNTIFDQTGSKTVQKKKATILNNLGILFYQQQNYQKCYETLEQSCIICDEIEKYDPSDLQVVNLQFLNYYFQGLSLVELRKIKDALKLFLRSKEMCEYFQKHAVSTYYTDILGFLESEIKYAQTMLNNQNSERKELLTFMNLRPPERDLISLYPSMASLQVIQQAAPEEATPEALKKTCSSIYIADFLPAKNIIRYISGRVHSSLSISGVGAEMIFGEGIKNTDHILYLYEFFDSEYRTLYFLSASLLALKEKSIFLDKHYSLVYSDQIVHDNYFDVSPETLKGFVVTLTDEYFGRNLTTDDILGTLKTVLIFNPHSPFDDWNGLEQDKIYTKENLRIGFWVTINCDDYYHRTVWERLNP